MKPISNKRIIHRRTVVSYNDKRQSVLQEALTRLRNEHLVLWDTVRDKHLMNGWNETGRHQVIKGALKF